MERSGSGVRRDQPRLLRELRKVDSFEADICCVDDKKA